METAGPHVVRNGIRRRVALCVGKQLHVQTQGANSSVWSVRAS